MFSKMILLAFVIATSSVLVQSLGQPSCNCNTGSLIKQSEKNGYKYTKGIGLHKIFTAGKTWEQANKICENEGGHLAIINSTDEKTLLVNMMVQKWTELAGNQYSQTLWIGVYNMQYNTNEWVTVNGDTVPTNSPLWGVNVNNNKKQPDNYDGEQNCGSLIWTGMDDVSCNHKLGYICELPIAC